MKTLESEIASPVSGVRDIWHDTQATSLTPTKLATILSELREGNVLNFLTLAAEMEEREAHFSSVIGTRKNALAGLEPVVEAASEEQEDIDLADEVRSWIQSPHFSFLVEDLLDALSKGFSVCEILWNHSPTEWMPRGFKWTDPRWFMFDKKTQELRLRDEEIKEGIQLSPYKWIVHYPRLKSGFPVSGGLARIAAVSFMCKNYTLKDWMRFIEVYGMPLRVGKYGPGATDQDKAVLKRAVVNIGVDAAAIIPDSMNIAFETPGNQNAGMALYRGTAEWLDKQMSKAVLGQTASTEGTPGKLGGDDAQDDVRRDILKKDAQTLGATLNLMLVRPVIDLNHGPRNHYPIIKWIIKDPEDIAALTKSVGEMVDRGLEVKQSEIREKLGLSDPGEDDVLLTPPAVTSGSAASAVNRAATRAARTALNRKEEDALEEILAGALADAGAMADETIGPIRDALLACNSFEDMEAVLLDSFGNIDTDRFVQQLALAQMKARASADHS